MKLRAVAALYMQSPEWGNLKPNSQRIYRYGMDKLEEFMKMDADAITRPMIIDLKDRLYHQPGVCRIALAALNNVLEYGYDRGHVKYNHAANMKKLPKTKPFKRWAEDEVQRFLENAPIHLRRAVLLALYTGQRRSDLTRLRWDQYDGEFIHLVQQKTGKELTIPVHPDLKEELAVMQKDRAYIRIKGSKSKPVLEPYMLLTTHYRPWQLNHLTRAIKGQCEKLGIKDRQLHGLRKTTASKLAELGCTPHEIASITGQSLQEVEHYTKGVEQKRMAVSAMGKWENGGLDRPSV